MTPLRSDGRKSLRCLPCPRLGFSFLVSLFAFLCTIVPPFAIALEATKYETALLAERESIAQLHLEMESDHVVGASKRITRSRREIWQDGTKRRCDEMREYLDENGLRELEPFRIVAIETAEYFVYWDGRPQPPPFRIVAHFERTEGKPFEFFQKTKVLPFDARHVGLRVADAFHLRDEQWGKNLGSVIGSPDRVAPAEITAEGDQVKVSFSKGDGLEVNQTYERRGDKHLLRSVVMTRAGGRIVMECGYPESLLAGIGFPQSLEVTVANGDSIVFREKSTLRLISVNEPIPRSVFSIVTANLPEATPVDGSAIPSELVLPFHHVQWNGEALVPVSNETIILREPRAEPAERK